MEENYEIRKSKELDDLVLSLLDIDAQLQQVEDEIRRDSKKKVET